MTFEYGHIDYVFHIHYLDLMFTYDNLCQLALLKNSSLRTLK